MAGQRPTIRELANFICFQASLELFTFSFAYLIVKAKRSVMNLYLG